MTNVEKPNIALTPDMVAELRAAQMLKIEDLRRLIQEGTDSGPGLDADGVFARLRARFGQPPST